MPQTIIEHRRLLARRLTHLGKEYSTVIVDISLDRRRISITPFDRETASTPYESRPLRTAHDAKGQWRLILEK